MIKITMSLFPFWRSIILVRLHTYREPLRDHCYIDGGSDGRAREPGDVFWQFASNKFMFDFYVFTFYSRGILWDVLSTQIIFSYDYFYLFSTIVLDMPTCTSAHEPHKMGQEALKLFWLSSIKKNI